MAESSTSLKQAGGGVSSLLAEIIPVVAFLRRWWFLAFCMVGLTSLTTLALVIVRGVEYQVSASLFFKLGPELAPPPTMGNDPLLITRRAEDVNDEIEIMTSPDLIHNVVKDLGEGFFRAPPPTTTFGKIKRQVKDAIAVVTDTIEEVMIQTGLRRRLTLLEKVELAINQKLKVELVRDSDVISLTLDTPSPDAGLTILNKLLDAYQERHLLVHQDLAVKDILKREKDSLRTQLDESSKRLLEFQLKADLWSPDDQQKLLLDNRKQLQQQVAASQGKIANLTRYVETLTQSVSNSPTEVVLSSTQQINPAVVNLEDKVAALNYTQAVVETAYRPISREAVDRQEQIDGLKSKLGKLEPLVPYSTSKGINVVRQDLEKEQAVKQSELRGLVNQLTLEERQLGQANGALTELGKAAAEYHRLQREHRLLEQKYALYTDSFEKADITAVMNLSQLSNMELISPPIASLEPVRPRLTIVAASGILSGLILAFLLAITFDLRVAARASRTVTTTD